MSVREIPFPREHGAWALLGGAFLLAWAHPWARGTAPLLLALAFLFAFALQAPLRSIAAGRGGAVWTWLVGYAGALLTCATLLVVRYGATSLLPAALFGLIFTGIDLVAHRRKLQRSVGHRILGAACISLLLPGMLSLFHPGRAAYAFVLWGLVLGYFLSRMPYVRANQAVRRGLATARRGRIAATAAHLGFGGAVGAGIAAGWFGPWILVGLLPSTLTALAPVRGLPNPILGRREIASLVWFLVWIVASFHLGGFDPLLR